VATVDVTPEGDSACRRATCEERRELDALRVVPGDLDPRAGVEVGGADVDLDAGCDAQPPAPLGAGLRLEVSAVGAFDGCLGQHRVAEEPAAARSDAAQSLAAIDHAREAQVVPGPPGDAGDVSSARLVERDRVRVRIANPRHGLLHHGGVRRLAVAAGQTGQAQVHLHQRVRRAGRRHGPRGSAAAGHGQHERATHRHGADHEVHDHRQYP